MEDKLHKYSFGTENDMKNPAIAFCLLMMTSCTHTSQEEALCIPEYPLEKRFASFSTGPDLILLRVASPSHKQTHVIFENPAWRDLLSRLKNREFSTDEYLDFMMEHHEDVFQMTDEMYEELVPDSEAILLPKHQKIRAKGRGFLLKEFMHKVDWGDDEHDVYHVSFPYDKLDTIEHNSLARLFIESGIRTYRDCESGYWEAIAILPKRSTQNAQQGAAPDPQ